jgi:putative alpha-1,2-mannosidase
MTMKPKAMFLLSAACWFLCCGAFAGEKRLVSYVDPFLGTGGHGHTYPGASVPFGMVQLSPDNGHPGWDWCSGYHYSDTTLVGFSHTHLSGTGCEDLGDISFMPTTSSRTLVESYRSPYSHGKENAVPGWYQVRLLDSDVLVELTATDHVGFHRYTFPATDSGKVLIDLKRGQSDTPTETFIEVKSPTLIVGYRYSNGWAWDQRVYFAARLSAPVASWSVYSGGRENRGVQSLKATDVRAIFSFDRKSLSAPLLIKVGISSASIEGAINNLDAEVRGWDFDGVRKKASEAWEAALSRVKIEADSATMTTFYTALYHAFLAPTEFSDVDGGYRGADGKLHKADGFPYYSTFSLWDTYRAEHPLFTILAPERVNGFVRSMLAFGHESGYLPVWPLAANETNCMVGYHAVPVIADAYLKGFRDFDAADALALMKKSAVRDHRGLKYYSMAIPGSFARASSRHATGPSPEGSSILAGFSKAISGSEMGYHSSHPDANLALIARANSSEQSIVWETATAPTGVGSTVAFVWIGGIAAEKGGHPFTLRLNGDSLLTFTTARTKEENSWSVSGKGGTRLSFAAEVVDSFNDSFGTMILTVPSSMLRAGVSQRLQVSGTPVDSPDWCMVFEYGLKESVKVGNEYGLFDKDGVRYQLVKINIDHLGSRSSVIAEFEGAARLVDTISIGQSILYLPFPSVDRERVVHGSVTIGAAKVWSDTLRLNSVRPIGYVPADAERESVSKTLEYAIDDYAISQMAGAMKHSADADTFFIRSQYYRNLFDSKTGFFRGRNLDGSWVTPFNPRFSTEKQPEYTEGNAWQYLWLVPHDVEGLIGLLGGRQNFRTQLDSLFEQSSDLTGTGATADVSGLIGLYAQGNEPSHHIAYLYNYADAPWKTQSTVRRIMKDFYKTGPEGLCGNEDCGQMSAWYIFSALGLYPLNPIGGEYSIGSPVVTRAEIPLRSGKSFILSVKNSSPENVYVQSVTLNGKSIGVPRIRHTQLMDGGTMEFVMGPKPNTKWGVSGK